MIKNKKKTKLQKDYFYSHKISIIEGAKVYAKLRKDVTAAGILERDYTYYTALCAIVFGGFFLGLYFMIIAQGALAIIFSGVMVALFAVQICGIFHDSGHRAVFKSFKNNDILGYFCCFLLAYTYRKWKVTHNKHHANPNEEEMDPDIERPMFSFNEKQMKSKRGPLLAISRLQAYAYYPIGSLTGIYSQVVNIAYFIRDHQKTKYWEKLLYFAGITLWLVVPFVAFGLTKAILIYISLYPLMGMYLFNVFAPNHKGMPQIRKNQKISFLEQQIVTSRNINSGFFTDILLMGLNYQTEHHLFPECPRSKLKLITPYTKAASRKLGLAYTTTGLLNSNVIILKELNEVAHIE